MYEALDTAEFDAAIRLRTDQLGGGLVALPPLRLSNARMEASPERGGPNGGYLAALAIRAAEQALTPGAPVRTVSVQYLAKPDFAPLTLEASRLRGARTTTFAQVAAHQDGETRFTAGVTFGQDAASPAHRPASRPAGIAQPEGLAPLDLPPAIVPHFTQLADYRPAGAGFPFANGEEAVIRIWMRLNDGLPLDAARLAFLFDAVFPSFYAVTDRPWPAATVDLRYDFARPLTPDVAPDGWALFEFTTRDWANGWAVEDGTAWNRAGELLGVARQLRKVLARGASAAV
ncbi:acyl-CoA thioesterase II [Caulobacter sp. 17J80-11]|uniref:acyl-CoA thioesterase n=1 Tax=Caulobacter sp. 17J80-11 TaxID=2763502 RepID=UPI001653CFEC|nr:thioesterase family protein [Caulobacter sp. 17J80-11]MBC6982617.1 thioesterase family protein [Caulobacter sp. 17J80-11]